MRKNIREQCYFKSKTLFGVRIPVREVGSVAMPLPLLEDVTTSSALSAKPSAALAAANSGRQTKKVLLRIGTIGKACLATHLTTLSILAMGLKITV